MGCMLFSPPLERDIKKKIAIKSGSTWEIELRGKPVQSLSLWFNLTNHRLQHMVRGDDKKGDPQDGSRSERQRNFDRFLSLRYNERT